MNTILIVDDMPFCLESIAQILRREGFDVLCSSSGEDALVVLSSHCADLLLLDVMMPGLDGLAVLGTLRKSERWRALPVILLTDAADEHLVRTAAHLGVQGYLLKSSFSAKELIARVRKLLPMTGTSASSIPDRPRDREMPRSRLDRPSAPAEAAPRVSRVMESEPPAPFVQKSVPNPAKSSSEVLARIRHQLELKSAPPVLQYVIALTSSSRSTIDEIVNAVRQDQALALKTMRIANSSFYARGKPAQNLIEATQRIGMAGLRNTAAAVLAIDHFAATSSGGLIPQRFWEHGLATAVLAQSIGEATGNEHHDELFLAGLLHDIGRLVLSNAFPADYQRVLAEGTTHDFDLMEAEREAFGLTHADITLEVLKQLKLPDILVAAASLHTRGVAELKRAGRDSRNALTVSLANRIAHAMVLGDSGNAMLHTIHEATDALSLDAKSVALLAREAADRTTDAQILYASSTDVQFRAPLAQELGQAGARQVRLTVFANDSPDDLVSLFCGRLGWLDPERPELAIVYATSNQQVQRRMAELRLLEERIGAKLGVLLALCEASSTPPEQLVGDRPCRFLRVPCRYSAVIQAVSELCDSCPAMTVHPQ